MKQPPDGPPDPPASRFKTLTVSYVLVVDEDDAQGVQEALARTLDLFEATHPVLECRSYGVELDGV
jgi:hypothetical protein